MKAIEILKDNLETAQQMEMSEKVINRYADAISELKALENRSCDGCKYYLSDNGNYPLEPCGECSRWYSDRWESKQ